jgi:hypothetical protein
VEVKRNRALVQTGNRPTLREPHRLEIHDLKVHHRIYERLGNEVLSYLVLSYLIVLCRRCHQHYHGILPEAA